MKPMEIYKKIHYFKANIEIVFFLNIYIYTIVYSCMH